MTKKILLLTLLAATPLQAKRELVDKVIARVNGANILHSDLSAPRINYDKFTLEQCVIQELYVQEATKRKALPSNTEVDKQIASLKTKNNIISDEEFEAQLKMGGFTLARYQTEIAREIAMINLLQMAVREQVFIGKEEVRTYIEAHPETQEERYLLKTTVVPFEKAKDEEELKAVTQFDWIESDWIKKSQLSDEMQFVAMLGTGTMGKPVRTKHGFQLVLLSDKQETRKRTFEERYNDVEEELRTKKMETFEEEFQDELKKRSVVVYV